jgi:hypothetical protein
MSPDRALAQIAGGLALLFGLYFTWRRVEVSQQQQITERFTRAIDQLGATDDKGKKKPEIRLGGIYALERIARDSERDHWPIMETLTTYVREHAPWPSKKDTQVTGFIPPPQAAQREPQASHEPGDPAAPEFPVPEPDIQAILTVLRRRPRYFGNGEVERLDLHQTNLRSGNLREAHLEGAILGEARLEGAILGEARLEGAILRAAHLERAYLGAARLERAVLWEAHLERAYLRAARLEEANLREAHLERADLGEAHLEGVWLLTEEQLEQAIGDETTKLPEGLKRPSSWAIYAAEQEDENDQA